MPLSGSTDDASSQSSQQFTPSASSPDEDAFRLEVRNHAGHSYELRDLSKEKALSNKHRESNNGLDDDQEDDIGDEEDEGFLGRRARGRTASVHSFQLYTPDEGKEVVKRLDRRVVLFMCLLYMLSFLDRSNIGNAKIAGMQHDLNISTSQYEWLLTAFYITYILFEWMTLLYRIIPAHIYVSICVLSWGLLASFQAVSTSFSGLLILRALLGVSEAAFGPGVPFYLSFFYRRSELAFRTGLFISAAPLATSFASSLAWLITKCAEGGPIRPWRLLFLLEGFPSIVVAAFAWEFIPDRPETAKFLTERQREVAVLRLRAERKAAQEQTFSIGDDIERKHSPASSKKHRWGNVAHTLLDPKCYLTAIMFFACNVSFSSMPVFLPTILHSTGLTPVQSQALSAPPYLFSFLLVLLTAHHSDRTRRRGPFLILHSALGALGYAVIALATPLHLPWWIKYAAIFPACAGFFSAITIIVTWTLDNQRSEEGKGTGVAVLNIIGQMGPLVGTRLYPERDAPGYVWGMSVCAFMMVAVGVLSAVLMGVLGRENRRSLRKWRHGGEGRGEGEKPFLYIL